MSLEKQVSSDQPSSVQVRKSSVPQPATAPSQRPLASDSPLPPPTPVNVSTYSLQQRDGEPYSASPPRSTSNLSMSSSQKHLPHKESTPSLASDISLPFATLELQQRLRQLQKYLTHTLSRYIGPHFFNAFSFTGIISAVASDGMSLWMWISMNILPDYLSGCPCIKCAV